MFCKPASLLSTAWRQLYQLAEKKLKSIHIQQKLTVSESYLHFVQLPEGRICNKPFREML